MGSPTTTPSGSAAEKEFIAPLWNVVLLDDDAHTYDYVVEMLMRLFVKTATEAYHHAVEVDSTGRTVVMVCEQEAAQYARDQIQNYGADWRLPRSAGSMTAILEPAA